MNKMGKKVMALLVVLTSIISFFPAEFIGQAVNAATTTSDDGSTIHIYNSGGNTPSEITATNDSTTSNAQYYACKYTDDSSGTFDFALNDVSTTTGALVQQATTNMQTASGAVSGITSQNVQITAINDIPCATADQRQALFNALGITIASSSYPGIVGERITGMPLGVGKITYNITVTTTAYNYTAAVYGSDGITVKTPASVNDPISTVKQISNQNATIYFGAEYINGVTDMTFKSYVGDAKYFDNNDNITDETQLENNQSPFLYITQNNVLSDPNMPLKYNFNVPFSLSKLNYIMNFKNSAYSSATIYKNGSLATQGADFNVTTDGSTTQISGNLGTPGASDLILVKLSQGIQRTFCVQIDYKYPGTSTDYALYNAGITKGTYANDDTVKAYIGKKFTVSKPSTYPIDNYDIYTGDIYISKKAGTISIDPTLVVDKDKPSSQRTMTYDVQNQYIDSSGNKKFAYSTLVNGKQYVNYEAGATNQLLVQVYNNGNQGSKTSSSVLVAEYILNVNLLDTTASKFSMGLGFDDNISTTYLTQPGVKANQISFDTNRLTYDLYTTNNNQVKVSFTGVKSSNNEYLKFWTATGINSNAFNTPTVNQSGDNYAVDLTGAKKMMVQAYYNSTTGTAVSYPVGSQYVFYLPDNYDASDTSSNTGNTSGNALLNNLQVANATLKDSGGNTTFSSSVYNYTTTVDKSSTTATITATTQDDNVQSIAATVQETGTSYDLTSGQASDITLNTSGTTTVKIVVTAQDGTTTKAYTVVISNNTKSSTATLKNVILNAGDYTFDPTADTTKVHESQNATSVTVTPVPTDASSTVTVNGQTYSSSPITVSIRGSQTTDIEIVVTSQDGTASKTYTLEVYRTDSTDTNTSNSSNSSTQDDQYYDQYNDCWVDTTKYDEWGTVNGNPVYFDKHNRQVKNAWISTGGKYYFLNNSGYRASGWKVDDADGKAYYLDPTTGEMKTGWINLSNSWYYLGLNGVMHKGWLYLNGKWYYFTPNGQMVINQSMFVEDKVYNFGQDGAVI
jgi:glucan-binding YG repeat protein